MRINKRVARSVSPTERQLRLCSRHNGKEVPGQPCGTTRLGNCQHFPSHTLFTRQNTSRLYRRPSCRSGTPTPKSSEVSSANRSRAKRRRSARRSTYSNLKLKKSSTWQERTTRSAQRKSTGMASHTSSNCYFRTEKHSRGRCTSSRTYSCIRCPNGRGCCVNLTPIRQSGGRTLLQCRAM